MTSAPRSRQALTPARVALYRRVAETSRGGRSLYDQAELLGVSYGQLKHLRHKAYVYGFEITPVSAENRRGTKYDTLAGDARLAAEVVRCPRCYLTLPHAVCLARNAVDHAERHMYRGPQT